MTKTPISLRVEDMTVFTRALSQQLGETSPSHLALMNMIARAAGFQNVQHVRSSAASSKRLAKQDTPVIADARSIEKTLKQFDNMGRLRQWPSKRSVQTLSLWALWSTLPASTHLNEPELNERLNAEHLFGDAATLRRAMVSCDLLTRKNDGTDYRRMEKEPPAEAKAVISAIHTRRNGRSGQMMDTGHA